MKTNMMFLIFPSLLAFALLCVHMVKTKGWRFMLYFVGSGLVFGFVRSRIIEYVQVDINKSFIPYEFAGKLLKIGNDSPVVYMGWIIVAYISWQLATMIISKINKTKTNQILPIVSLSFFIIAALSYANETAASVAGWWNWNAFLTSNFPNSIFVNVPWVGIVDWATVSLEFLAIFLLFGAVLKTRKWIYLLILALPLLHWTSHINIGAVNIYNFPVTPSLVFHLLLPIIALSLWFIPSPHTDWNEKPGFDKYIFGAIYIVVSICIFAEIYYGHSLELLISVVPITLFGLFAISKVHIKYIYLAGILATIPLIFLPNMLNQTRLLVSLFPILTLGLLELISMASKPIHDFLKNNRKSMLILLVSLFVIISVFFLSQNKEKIKQTYTENPKDKIILITLDTVPAGHVGAYGYGLKTTANFDKFAAENTLFKNAYSPVPYTYPAHFSIFSGLYPINSHVVNNTTKNLQNAPGSLLSEMFSNKGYLTTAFISSPILDSEEIRKGFGTFDTGNLKGTILPTERGVVDQRTAQKTNEIATKWIDENKNDGFFAWIHYYDPHSPYRPSCSAPDFVGDKLPDDKSYLTGDIYDQAKINTPVSQNDIDYLSARYDQDLYCTDQALGELFTNLKALDIYDDTTIIVVGDHGENFDHGTIFHGDNLYESAIKIPMAIKYPQTAKKIVNSPVSLIDIYPTLVSIFKLSDFNQKRDGVNLTMELSDNRSLFFQTTNVEPSATQNIDAKPNLTAILQTSKKLIENYNNNTTETYNLSKDPYEETNMSPDNLLQGQLKIFFNSTK